MQTITANQKQHLYEGGYVGVTITVAPISGAPFTITDDDIVEGSFSIERNWALGSNIEIGCADTAELSFMLDNSDGQWSGIQWEGAQLTVIYDIDGEPLQAGIFTVDEPPRKLTTMQIKALDDMAKFNRPYNTDLEYPASLLQIIQDACSKCNVPLGTVNFTNKEYIVGNRPEGQDITYHHIVAWVAELAGTNAWIDHLRRLQLSWYGDNQTGDLVISPDDMMVYTKVAEADIEITGIAYYPQGTEQGYIVGTDTYALVIEGNPLLQDNIEDVLSEIFDKIGGFTYRPYEIETLGYPHIWPGDIITTLTDVENNEYTSIITNHTYKLNGNSKLQAKGETQTVKGYATGAPFTPQQKRVLQTVAKIEAARQTSVMEQAVLQLNELMINSLGYYTTTVEQGNGAKITYIHDKQNLEESQIIWTMTEQGFAWTDEGWQGGTPIWKYGVMADGSIVTKFLSAVGIKADWITIGPETKYEPEEIYTWKKYEGMTWQDIIDGIS